MAKRKKKSQTPPSNKRTGPQRPQAKSPTPSSETISSDDSWPSSPSLTSRSPTPDLSEIQPTNNTQSDNPKIPLPPPIIIPASLWRIAAPKIFQNPEVDSVGISAKSSADGKINLKTSNVTQFRQIQKTLLTNNIGFHTHTLAADRQLKVVLKGIPTDISDEDLKNELIAHNFEVQMTRRFGTADKPMPICLVMLTGTNSKDIFDLTELFYLKIVVEHYRKSGPSQCHTCQRFGHGSHNCGNQPRCVKCAGDHRTSDCQKTRDQTPTCVNCNGPHTANYRGCPSYIQSTNSLSKSPPNQLKPLPVQIIQNQIPQRPHLEPTVTVSSHGKHPDYATATKNKPAINTDSIITLLTKLLSDISKADDPKSIICSTLTSFLNILTNSHE